jgi:hypothetical protein
MSLNSLVENLDAATPDDLRAYARRVREIRGVLASLATYAEEKAEVIEQRARGDVAVALLREKQLEAIYGTLPRWARW